MKIAVGCDHVGRELKNYIIEYLTAERMNVQDLGTYTDERCNYPDYAYAVAKAVASGKAERGILCCGTGVGIGIAANKVHGIRCVTCSEPYSAQLSRKHNNTNILSMGSRVVGRELAIMIVKTWLETDYEGGRHEKRIQQISEIEDGIFDLSTQ